MIRVWKGLVWLSEEWPGEPMPERIMIVVTAALIGLCLIALGYAVLNSMPS
jgi:hypothetical protein